MPGNLLVGSVGNGGERVGMSVWAMFPGRTWTCRGDRLRFWNAPKGPRWCLPGPSKNTENEKETGLRENTVMVRTLAAPEGNPRANKKGMCIRPGSTMDPQIEQCFHIRKTNKSNHSLFGSHIVNLTKEYITGRYTTDKLFLRTLFGHTYWTILKIFISVWYTHRKMSKLGTSRL